MIDRQGGRESGCKESNSCLLWQCKKSPEHLLIKASWARGRVKRSFLSSRKVTIKHTEKEKNTFLVMNTNVSLQVMQWKKSQLLVSFYQKLQFYQELHWSLTYKVIPPLKELSLVQVSYRTLNSITLSPLLFSLLTHILDSTFVPFWSFSVS